MKFIFATALCCALGCTTSPTSTAAPSGDIDLSVDAPTPDWTLGVPRFAVSVEPGQTATYDISLTANSTFAGTVSMSSSGAPRHSTPVFEPPSYTLTPNEQDTGFFKIETTSRTAPGTYDVVVISQSGATENEATVTLVVQ